VICLFHQSFTNIPCDLIYPTHQSQMLAIKFFTNGNFQEPTAACFGKRRLDPIEISMNSISVCVCLSLSRERCLFAFMTQWKVKHHSLPVYPVTNICFFFFLFFYLPSGQCTWFFYYTNYQTTFFFELYVAVRTQFYQPDANHIYW
jgi:hypothetical protein